MAEKPAAETTPTNTPPVNEDLPPDVLEGMDTASLGETEDEPAAPAEEATPAEEPPAEPAPAEEPPAEPPVAPAEPAPAPAQAPEAKPAPAVPQPSQEPEGPTVAELEAQFKPLAEQKATIDKEIRALMDKEDFDEIADTAKLTRLRAKRDFVVEGMQELGGQYRAIQQRQAQQAEQHWQEIARQNPGVDVRKLWADAVAEASTEYAGEAARGVATHIWKQKLIVAKSRSSTAKPSVPASKPVPAAAKTAPKPGGRVAPASTVPARTQPREEDELAELQRNLRGKVKTLGEH